jgi:hypothetical protein
MLLLNVLGVAPVSTHSLFDLFDKPGVLPNSEPLPSVNEPAPVPFGKVPVQTLVSKKNGAVRNSLIGASSDPLQRPVAVSLGVMRVPEARYTGTPNEPMLEIADTALVDAIAVHEG